MLQLVPSPITNKKVLLGISGGIAAYKIPELVRLLVKAGAEVRVVMTPMAHHFVTAQTLSTLSKNPVLTHFFKNDQGEWNNHVELGLWADAFIIAPAGANTIGKMAQGINDNLLLTTYLSARCPVFFAPAMDLDMFQHPSVKANINTLVKQGCHYIAPGNGELASGLHGEGRMAEPEQIFEILQNHFRKAMPFSGKKVLVSAGPTYENIDPVRFIGNYSTGKMGYAIAESFAAQGAQVTLVSGPVALPPPLGIDLVSVQSAGQMLKACTQYAQNADVIVMAAAVADYKPHTQAKEKIKKKDESLELKLVKTTDVLGTLGQSKGKSQFLVGFALETQNEKENAAQKLKKKNLDMIVLNSMNDAGAGFGHDTNKVTVLFPNKKQVELPLQSKKDLAKALVNMIADKINSKK